MVGHTGVRDAAVLAVEAVDLQLGRLIPVVQAMDGAVLVTADHGNADEMFEVDKKTKRVQRHADGRPKAKTSHTLNPVPLHIALAPGRTVTLRDDLPSAGLSNVAATALDLLGYSAPEGYDPSLLAG
jgi:2,3-bisphosphoglycerate-independent phosphoglycerate mutase